jgi:peptidoglycan-associated lipoprotein
MAARLAAEKPSESKEEGRGTKLGQEDQVTGNSRIAESDSLSKLADAREVGNMTEDREVFKTSTVYFAYDQASVRPGETSKLDAVGQHLKGKLETKILIEGFCDERGTEEYNRSLGERRALALREYLIHYGISAERIVTRSWGEDKPVDPGHTEEAWSKNRRGEFVLLKPQTMASSSTQPSVAR